MITRDVADDDLEVLYEQQRSVAASLMAARPSRERAAFMAHWAKIRADESVLTQTVLVAGEVAANVVSWQQSGRRLVGYWIGETYWGRGIATIALAGFLRRELSRPLHAYVAVHNVGSIRVLEKCGFQRIADSARPPAADEDGVEVVTLVLES